MVRRARRARLRVARLGATARFAVAGILFVVILFLAVFPTRTYLRQRDAISSTKQRISMLRAENDRMRSYIRQLQKPQEIERIAREQYNLAKPGEDVYVIIPSDAEALRQSGSGARVIETIRQAWGIAGSPASAGATP